MPSERPIIIQQSQSQTQGCCAGSGCGTLVLIVLVFAAFGAIWEAMTGVHGTGWQIAAWVGVPLVMLLVVAGGIGLVGERFGWFEQATGNAPRPEQRDAADIIVEDELNYGDQNPAPDRPVRSLETRLRGLARLRDEGLITDEDYETQKKRMLDAE